MLHTPPHVSDENSPLRKFSQYPISDILISADHMKGAGVLLYRRQRGGYGKGIAEGLGTVLFSGLGREYKTSHTVVFAVESGYGVVTIVQQKAVYLCRSAVGADRLESDTLWKTGDEFPTLREELDVERLFGRRFDKDGTTEYRILRD